MSETMPAKLVSIQTS